MKHLCLFEGIIIFTYNCSVLKKTVLIISAFLFFFGCKKSDQIVPSQPPPSSVYDSIKVTGTNYILGNREKNIPDSFIVQYNKKIIVNYVLLKSQFCLPDIKREVSGNGTTVKFYNIICSGLGSEYTFEISVTDNSGVTKIDSVNYKCYNRKLAIDADIQSYFVTGDNKYCWMLTTNPSQLLQIDIENTLILKKIPLNFTPAKAVLNEQNNRLYILRSVSDYVFPHQIFVMNPASGLIEKTIPVLPDQYDHPQGQHVYAYDINFARNGYGVLLIGEVQNSALRWKVIDSQLNDSVYIHPEWLNTHNGTGNPKFGEFQSAYANYDKTKILMPEVYGSARLGELDYLTHSLVEVVPPNAGTYYSNFITPNKINNSVFFGTVRAQFILSGNAILGYQSSFDLGFERSADFTYLAGDEQNIYFLIRPDFYVLDYKNGKTLMSTRVAYELHDVNATTNGKYIIFAGNRQLFIFDTPIFYRHN